MAKNDMAKANQPCCIFTSWHDDKTGKSRSIATELESFIYYVFGKDNLEVFLSADLSSGNWKEHIKSAFEKSNFAIFILTEDAINSLWVNFEFGAFYMKTLLHDNPIPHENLVVYQISDKNTSSGSPSPVKDVQVVPIYDQNKVRNYFEKIAIWADITSWEQRFEKGWETFDTNISGFYRKGRAHCRKEYPVDNEIMSLPSVFPTSIDDIDFNKIEFNYKLPKRNDEPKKFFGRKDFVENLHTEFEKGNNCLNVVATGGMGKTSVAHKYIAVFGQQYEGRIFFVTSNYDIQKDFNVELRNCMVVNDSRYDKILQPVQENSADVLTKQIVKVLSKTTKKCLLVVDVNIDEEHLQALNLDALRESQQWHILYLSRKKIDGAKQDDSFELPNFEDDIEGAEGLFNDIYKDNGFDSDQLRHLFELVYYHPLLIEQLAAYGVRGKRKQSYDDLCEVLSDVIENDATDTDNKEGIWLKDKNGHDYNVCSFLKKLISYSDYPEKYQYMLRHFVLWPYDYISLDAINQLLKNEKRHNFDNHLSDLVDKMIFSTSEKGFCMHGVLRDVIVKDLEKIPNVDYTNYVRNVKTLIKSGSFIDFDTDKCICNTPLIVFGIGSDKDYSVYEDWKFLRRLAQLKIDDAEFSELSYKAKLLKELYHQSGKEIYEKVYGEYKDVSSHILYYKWLEGQSAIYNRPLPSEHIDTKYGSTYITISVKGIEFKMIKVSDDYFIAETQVTQELWESVMGYNPSYFNKDKLSPDTSQRPVEKVSWYDCMDFIIKLNEEVKFMNFKFNLPTDNQWDYAARAGYKNENFEYSGSDDFNEVAWCGENSQGETHPVITSDKKPNGLGIYGMSGNVWEWCQDWYTSGSSRVLRGGSWRSGAEICRVSYRYDNSPDIRISSYGMRLALPCSSFPS